MRGNYGTVTTPDGILVHVTEQPYLSYLSKTHLYCPMVYFSTGVDSGGQQYEIEWDVIPSEDDKFNCDWNKPVAVVIM